mgnify:CR=1 FL=1
MADRTDDGEDTTTTPPTEEARQTETVNDEIKPKGVLGPESKDDGPDVSARLDALEKELAALKAMMDTLGYTELPAVGDGDGGEVQESIEDLFD